MNFKYLNISCVIVYMAALPLDIINKINSYIPTDKNFKSPTSDFIKREFDKHNNYYDVDRHDEPFNSFTGYWFHLYFFFF